MKRFIIPLMSLMCIFQLYSMEETPELISAVKKDNMQRVTKLLERHENINVQDKDGNTPLSVAARLGSLPLVKLLLANGAEVDLCNNDALCPLHSAVMSGHLEIARQLLDNGADVNAADDYRGRTPLLWVGRMTEGSPKKSAPQIPVEKSVQIVKLLLERGADPARVDFTGKTTLDWAKIFKLQPLVAVLTKAANDKAVARGHRAIVQAQNVAPKVHAQQFKFLSSQPVASCKKIVAVSQKTMATPPAKVKDYSNMTIWEAAAAGDIKAFNWCYAHGQSPLVVNQQGETLLMIAVANGRLELAQRLLKYHGADVNAKDKGKATALMHAALHGHANLVKLLIDWGANIAAEDSIGRRASDYAESSQNEATIDLLQKAEKNLGIQRAKGKNAVERQDASKEFITGALQEKLVNVKKETVKAKIAPQQSQLSKAQKEAIKAQKKAASKAQSEADKAKNKAKKAAKVTGGKVPRSQNEVVLAKKAAKAAKQCNAQSEAARRKAQSEADKALAAAKATEALNETLKNKKLQPQNINNNNNLGWLIDLSHAAPFRIAYLSLQRI